MSVAILPHRVLSMLNGAEEIDFSRAVDILLEIEARPNLYLTTGSACAAYEVIRDWVEGGRSYE